MSAETIDVEISPLPATAAGRVVCVVGPDGVGKTTASLVVVERFLSGRPVWHMRFPRLLPRLHRPPVGADKVVPEKKVYPRPHRRGISSVKLIYLFVDYLLGWMIRVRPHVKRGGWVVIERGWWDMAVDPRRYRLRSPARLARFLGRLLPATDGILVLQSSPETILARKPQLPRDELVRQMALWPEVMPAMQHRVYIDASRPLDDVLVQCRRALLDISTPTSEEERR